MYLASIFGISGVLLSVSCAPHFGFNPYWLDDSDEMDPWWNDWRRPHMWFEHPGDFIATPHPFYETPYPFYEPPHPFYETPHLFHEGFPSLFNDDWSQSLDNMQRNLNDLRDVAQQFPIVPTINVNETWFDDASNNQTQNISGGIDREANNKTTVETKIIDGKKVTIKESTIKSNKDGVKKLVHQSEIYFDDKSTPNRSWWDNWFKKEGEESEPAPKPKNWLGRLWGERILRRGEYTDESTARNWLGRLWGERRLRSQEDTDESTAEHWLWPFWSLWNNKRDVEDEYDWFKPTPKHYWWGELRNKDGTEVDNRSIRDYADTGLFNMPLGRK
uniref:Uncharacterized protein n=1 Tax=Cacopsylla melanoneura TaxID=428564 RepID=A0A8D8Y7Y8_9HEMI